MTGANPFRQSVPLTASQYSSLPISTPHAMSLPGIPLSPCSLSLNNMIVLDTGQQESGSSGLNTRTLVHAMGSPPPFRSL